MGRRIITAREQHEMLSPWREAAQHIPGLEITNVGDVVRAHINGEEAGWMEISRTDDDEPFVGNIEVAEQHRRKGVGTAMWEAAGRPPHDLPEYQTDAGKAWANTTPAPTRKRQPWDGLDYHTGSFKTAADLVKDYTDGLSNEFHDWAKNADYEQRTAARLAMPWRTEHPDYQPADVAHNYNPDIGGAQGGGGHKNYLVGPAKNVWWHGSGSGDIGGGDADFGLHVGDYQTAADNLNARLGLNPNHPQGRWTGQHSLAEAHPDSYDENGNSVPNHMGYHRFTHSDGSPMHGSYRPNVFPLAIVGPMGNTTDTAVSDGQAHALIRRQRTRPPKTPKGYYYINAGEGHGVSPETGIVSAVSAAVPSVSHIQKLDPAEHEHIAQDAHKNWYDQKYNNPDKGSYDMSKVDGMPPTSMERYQELQRQKKEQENGALEWRRRRRGY